ncbi:MAG TPA: lactate racemase domain-containing protein [Vicinamibacterales bacterium]|nr:lactate racemase domain-containing protein [Vicinamibacterales bacterium]
MVTGGSTAPILTRDEVHQVVAEGFAPLPIDGRRVLALIPDRTRTMPMPMMFDVFEQVIGRRAAALDYLVALGTHQPLGDDQLAAHLGRTVAGGVAGRSRIFNHRWDDPATFVTAGVIPAHEVSGLTDGLMVDPVPVTLNRLLFEYDHVVICGPVFPHEVVGFSGGNKYLVPGVAGPGVIDLTHWIGALMTSSRVIGAGYTPVRAVIDRAAAMVDRPVTCTALVVTHQGLSGVFVGPAREAWEQAAALSARLHIVRVARPFSRVLSIMPAMYDDLWTAAKGMYKLEPVVADGGEVIIYAPDLTEVSYTHGALIDEIGYHCRDYFLGNWARFGRYPGGVLAHSTHLKGLGTFDRATGREEARISVTLATRIPADRCARINLGYLDPATIRIDEWTGREAEGILVVPRAGEMLYRLAGDQVGVLPGEETR